MKLLAGIGVLASLVGCAHFEAASVRHSHAQSVLVQGASVAPWNETAHPLKRHTGLSKIVPGDRVVLLVQESDNRPGWTDSGSSEGLVIELPALERRTSWRLGPEGARAWMWYLSAWEILQAQGVEGAVETDTVDGHVWSVRVDLHARWAGARISDETLELRHDFTLLPVSYEEFQRSDAGWWSR